MLPQFCLINDNAQHFLNVMRAPQPDESLQHLNAYTRRRLDSMLRGTDCGRKEAEFS